MNLSGESILVPFFTELHSNHRSYLSCLHIYIPYAYIVCVIHCKNINVHNQSEHEREPTTELTSDTCCGGSQSGGCSGGGSGDSCSRWTFELANVIISHGTNHVIYPITCIAQTTMSIICPNPMGLVLPSTQVASIRVPFQLVVTITIFTIFIVRV